jgi:predicted phage terminase large subunit-like protein
MEGITRVKDKTTRAFDAAPYIENGSVLMPSNAAFMSDLLIETRAFPTGANDDQVDPLLDAVSKMLSAPVAVPRIRQL